MEKEIKCEMRMSKIKLTQLGSLAAQQEELDRLS